MIVKNEKDMLADCLESVKEADEIIVCDTGSEDNTIEIAKKYTDKVYTDFVWCDHFAKARNHSLSKCTGDWILIIDADEVLKQDMDFVRKEVERAEKIGADFINCNVISAKNSCANKFPRMFRRIPEIKWYGAAHNYLAKKGGEKKMLESDLAISYKYSPAHNLDPDRTLRILSKAVKEDPTLIRERYYLAREYYYRRKYKPCIRHLKKYVKDSRYKSERADGYWMMAKSYWYTQQGNKAREACLQAIGINPNFKEALLLMSEMYYEPGKTRWTSFAELADNSNVLFIRDTGSPTEKDGDYYDKLLSNSDLTRYENIYKKIGEWVGDKKVLDIGCGPGALSEYIFNYSGFDFAKKTIEKAEEEGLDVWYGNALEVKNYKPADIYIATEVLEHIQDDTKILKNIPKGADVILSVPSFMCEGHVRSFTPEILQERYKDLLNIKEVIYYKLDGVIADGGKWIETDVLEEPYILLAQATRLV